MAMALSRSVLARVARGRHSVSQTFLPAWTDPELSLPSARWMLQRYPTADHMGKRYFSDGKGQWFYSALDKLPNVTEYVPLSSIITLCAFTYGMATMIPYTIANTRAGRLNKEMSVDDKADPKTSY